MPQAFNRPVSRFRLRHTYFPIPPHRLNSFSIPSFIVACIVFLTLSLFRTFFMNLPCRCPNKRKLAQTPLNRVPRKPALFYPHS